MGRFFDGGLRPSTWREAEGGMGNSFLFLRWQELKREETERGDRENSAELLKDFASVFT